MHHCFIVVKSYQHLRIRKFQLQASDREKVNKIFIPSHHPNNSFPKLQNNSILQPANQ